MFALSRRPLVVVAVGVVFTSFSAILIRLSSSPPLAIAAYRMVFTVLMLSPLFILETRRGGHNEHPAETSGTVAETSGAGTGPVPRRRAILLSVASGTFLSLHFATWIASLSYTSVASSTVLVTTHPIIVATLGALFLGERLRFRSMAFILAAVGGTVLLVANGTGEAGSTTGNLLAFLGAVAVSGYIILGRVVRQWLSVNRYTFITYATAAGLLVIYAIVAGVPLFPYPPRELGIFAALALVCTLLGHSLFNWALRFVRPSVVSTSILGEPIIATALAVVVFGEVPRPLTIVGGAVILLSIYLFVRSESGSTRHGRIPARTG